MSRFRDALLRWVGRSDEPAGLEALFAEPVPTPTAEGIERRRAVTEAYWFLREGSPDLWYAAPHLEVLDLAEALATLRRGVEEGRWKP